MSGLLELAASSLYSEICSPLCSFCEESYNMKRKGGREEHYILNSLRKIIAKSPSRLPCSPSLLAPLAWLRLWDLGKGLLQKQLLRADPRALPVPPQLVRWFRLTFLGQCSTRRCCPQEDIQKIFFRERWAVLVLFFFLVV